MISRTLRELTTAITNFILAGEALIFAVLLIIGNASYASSPFWVASFVFFALAAVLGGFFHGYGRPRSFLGIYILMAAMMASFLLAALVDFLGYAAAMSCRWYVIGATLIVIIVSIFHSAPLKVLAVCQGVVFFGVLYAYSSLLADHALAGAENIIAGVVITLAGALLYVRNVGLKLVWEFDRNGVYHLVQMVAVLFFYLGLRLR